MSGLTDAVNAHYAGADIRARIRAALVEAGKDLDALTRDDLALFDEFHGGGRPSTRELARFAAIAPGERVLDVGSGVGGPARTLTAEFGCRVTGVDLTREFCLAAEMLCELVGMAGAVEFRNADACDLPFDDATFDVAWSQNAMMNVPDKGRMFAEIARVLRPGGRLAFETAVAGDGRELRFPTFWASSAALNHLAAPAEIREMLHAAGLREKAWEDTTARSVAMARKRRAAMREAGAAPGLTIGVIVPDAFEAKLENSLANNEEGRTATVQAVWTKPP